MPEPTQHRKPDYILKIRPRTGGQRHNKVGAGWETKYGIDIVLDPGTVLKWDDPLYINLYRRNDDDDPAQDG